jgi:hypothetical protein
MSLWERRPAALGTTTLIPPAPRGGRTGRGDPVVVDPVLNLMFLEADEAPDIDDRDSPFGHQSPIVALTRPQAERNIGHGDERPWVLQLPTAGSVCCTQLWSVFAQDQ